jgi:dTDP-4-amino-4,6-dideoxygalactose transaminase
MINISKPIIGKEEINAVVSVMKSGMIVQGPKTAELEVTFAKYCKTKYAVALNSGTAAIHAGLYALGITKGDEVITSPFTFVASANPIVMLGGKVIFADISEEDFNLDPREVEKKITQKTKAILPIDLYGQIYDYNNIKKIAKKHKIKILEDACQAHGAEQGRKKAGVFGNVSAFSLYATKNMMSGEGGLITTDSKEIMEKCKRFRHHGQSEKTKYEYWDMGYNYRLTDLCATIAIEQLKKIDTFNVRRISNAQRLSEGLRGIRGLILPCVKKDNKHVFHQYTIRITDDFKSSRDKFINYLKKSGIDCGVYYPKPLHLHPHFVKMGYKEGDFPVAENMSKQVLSLPVHPSLTAKEIQFIVSKIKGYVE